MLEPQWGEEGTYVVEEAAVTAYIHTYILSLALSIDGTCNKQYSDSNEHT